MKLFTSNATFSFTETTPLPYPYYEQDVATILDSVKILFSKYFDDVDKNYLQVVNVYPSDEYPMTIYEQNKIYLRVSPFDKNGSPGCYWCQIIYQFSHEFCHYMNFGHVVKSMRWFEEVLCELASHFFLLKSVENWAVSPPHDSWRSYSQALLSYELENRKSITTFDFKNDFHQILTLLESDEYQRKLNRFIALCLLPLFIEKPSLWKIVPCLIELHDSNPFHQNLKSLGNLSGEDVSDIESVFYPSDN